MRGVFGELLFGITDFSVLSVGPRFSPGWCSDPLIEIFGEVLPGLEEPFKPFPCKLVLPLPLLPSANKLLELVEKSWLDSVTETSSSSPSDINSIKNA